MALDKSKYAEFKKTACRVISIREIQTPISNNVFNKYICSVNKIFNTFFAYLLNAYLIAAREKWVGLSRSLATPVIEDTMRGKFSHLGCNIIFSSDEDIENNMRFNKYSTQ